jgi:hypothetical protein
MAESFAYDESKDKFEDAVPPVGVPAANRLQRVFDEFRNHLSCRVGTRQYARDSGPLRQTVFYIGLQEFPNLTPCNLSVQGPVAHFEWRRPGYLDDADRHALKPMSRSPGADRYFRVRGGPDEAQQIRRVVDITGRHLARIITAARKGEVRDAGAIRSTGAASDDRPAIGAGILRIIRP